MISRDDAALVGDAAIMTGALNALLMGLVMLVTEVLFDSTMVPSWIEALSGIFFNGGAVAGPVIAWLLAGRKITVSAVVGGFLGVGIAAAVFGVLAGLVFVLRRFIGGVMPDFPLELVIVASLFGLGLAIVAGWLIRDAIKDRKLAEPLHPLRDTVRIASVAVIALYCAVIAVLAFQPDAGEIAEAPIFMLMVAIVGAGIAAGAVLAGRVLARKPVAGASAPA
jgi:hypothetical protein